MLRPVISAPLPWLTWAISLIRPSAAAKGAPGARSKKRKYSNWPRSLSVTRVGKWYIAVLFFIGIAAINTGNNLLYLILATLLSLIITSGVMSESTLRDLKVSRTLPRHVFKSIPAFASMRIENAKRYFPSMSFTVAELDCPGVSADKTYVFRLGESESVMRSPAYVFAERGVHRLDGVEIKTRFPFGLFVKGKRVMEEAEVLVFPNAHSRVALQRPGARPETIGARGSAVKGAGEQLWGLRDYTLLDDSRFIHWRSIARTSRLMYKEHEKESEERVTIIFDNYLPKGQDGREAQFESMVDEAASIALLYIERGWAVGLRTLEAEIKPAHGASQLHAILTTLALITPDRSDRGSARIELVES